MAHELRFNQLLEDHLSNLKQNAVTLTRVDIEALIQAIDLGDQSMSRSKKQQIKRNNLQVMEIDGVRKLYGFNKGTKNVSVFLFAMIFLGGVQ